MKRINIIGTVILSGFLVAIAIFSFSGQGIQELDRKQVIGTWIGEHQLGREELVLLDNGQYKLTFFRKDGSVFSNSNTWEKESLADGTQIVTFHNYAFGGIQRGPCNIENLPCDGNSYWPAFPQRDLFNQLYIEVDSDTNYKYLKQ